MYGSLTCLATDLSLSSVVHKAHEWVQSSVAHFYRTCSHLLSVKRFSVSVLDHAVLPRDDKRHRLTYISWVKTFRWNLRDG